MSKPAITVHSISNDGRLSAVISGIEQNPDFNLWFSVPDAGLTGDPFVAALLPVAMRLGQDLEIKGAPVSSVLLQQIPQIQALWSRWYKWKQIRIVAPTAELQQDAQGIGCFFSGGVDSFFTLLKLLKSDRKPTHLIFAHGFDIPLAAEDQYGRVRTRIERIARELNVTPVFPASNIRELTDPVCNWGLHQNGAALAALALAMQSTFRTVVVPASRTYADAPHWGSHPLLDPLWSTESLSMIHDGCEATRVQKVMREIAKSDIALAHVRVCWETKDEYNCGRCEKCVRTMVNLAVADCLDRCDTFPRGLSGQAVLSALNNADKISMSFAIENLEELEKNDLRPDLQEALRRVVQQRRYAADIKSHFKRIDEAMFGGFVRRILRTVR